MRRLAAALAGIVLALPCAAPGRAQDKGDAATEQRIERILELHEEIDRLLETLPPEARVEITRRLAQRREAERAAPEPVLAEEPVPVMTPPRTPSERRRRACNTLWILDTNRDGTVDAADRYWRYLHLWIDNGDGTIDPREITSPYDRKVREISVALDTFEGAKKGIGEIRVDDYIVLDLDRDGFQSGRDDAALMLDTGAIRRGDGPEILDRDGRVLDAVLPFAAGWQVRVGDEVTALECP